MADSSEPAFLFLYRKGAVAPVDYLSTFATAPLPYIDKLILAYSQENTNRLFELRRELEMCW